MGELALRRINAGVETVRGTAVPATRKVYGTMSMTRAQQHRFATEDRGIFTDKFRGNRKLIDAGFSLARDMLFEDEPFHLAQYLNGGISQTGSGTAGYTWAGNPDTNTDSLKTVTWEAGDDTVQWQGVFGTTDTADYTLALDDVVTCTQGGWVKDWTISTSSFLTTSFTGFTAGLTEHAVEGVSGWQAKLYIDAAGGTAGTTQIVGKLVSAQWGYHNQNKRKYFGDGSAVFTKLGRGRRQVHAQITFEASDQAQYADYFASLPSTEKVVRISLGGTGIVGSTGPVPKAANYDFWGLWDTFVIGNRDTNTTFQLDLQTIYDSTAGKECAATVINGSSTL